jgi:hypothetical protein
MMTVAAIMGGLLPIMWTTGTGADVMKRIAAPMIGGMVSSTILTLVVIPVLYMLWRGRSMPTRTRSRDTHISMESDGLKGDLGGGAHVVEQQRQGETNTPER